MRTQAILTQVHCRCVHGQVVDTCIGPIDWILFRDVGTWGRREALAMKGARAGTSATLVAHVLRA
jgi:hypothetical protein